MTVRGQHEVRGGGGVGQRGHLVQWFLAWLQSNITFLHVPQRATQGGGRGGHRVVLPARAGRQLQVVLAAADDDADAVVYGIAHLAPDGRLGVSLCVCVCIFQFVCMGGFLCLFVCSTHAWACIQADATNDHITQQS